MSEGHINQMMCCHLLSDKGKKDAVVIRIFIQGMTGVTIERNTEVMAIQVAAHIKIGQPAYAVFRNGIAYRFAPGRSAIPEDVKNPKLNVQR